MALGSAEKKKLKKQKDEMNAKYMTCSLDGRQVANFRTSGLTETLDYVIFDFGTHRKGLDQFM